MQLKETWLSAWLALLLPVLGLSWDYATNGADWANIPGRCGAGGAQSPIDLPLAATKEEKDNKLWLKYPKLESAFQLYHNGYSIALTVPESYKGGFGLAEELDSLSYESGEGYRLWQVNFHSPSEHKIAGRQLPLEMQLMHQKVTGGDAETAVVVVLFDAAPNTYVNLLDKLMNGGLPDRPWEEKTVTGGVDFGSVITGSPYFKYDGAISVPPCEGNVKYFVRQYPVPAAHSQLQEFNKVLTSTCGPNGNFRAVKPLVGPLSLITGADAISGDEVKPKIAKVDLPPKPAAPPGASEDEIKKVFIDNNCKGSKFYDEKFKNLNRIQVSDSKQLVLAKETYNRNLREKQVAEAAEGNAFRALKFAQDMYDNAPGLAEKINLKWALEGAKAVEAGAKANLAKYAGNWAAGEFEKLNVAIFEDCFEKTYRPPAASAKKDESDAAAKAPPPPPPPASVEKVEYPEPHLELPRGLEASPFAEKGAEEGGGDAGAAAVKISPNLHQPDIAPSAMVTAAKGAKDEAVQKKKPEADVEMSVVLPYDAAAIKDKDAFKKDIIKAFAKSARIPSDRLVVREIKSAVAPKVHQSALALAQETEPRDRSGLAKDHHFLRATRLH